MKCQKCQTEVILPFQCPYCKGYFCPIHRLPENHECPRIELASQPRDYAPSSFTSQKEDSYEYTVTYTPQTAKGKLRFSAKEMQHLAIATPLVVGVGLSLVGFIIDDYALLALFTLIFAASFFTHEMAHKIAAQRRGLWVEFRLTVMGALLTLMSIVSPFFKIISPGAVMIAGYSDRETIGRISIAGPLTNICLSLAFFAAYLVPTQFSGVFLLGTIFNAWIALFNLIPIGILDGLKVFSWDKRIWAAAFTLSLVLTVHSYLFT
ncbi:MAG: AN1-type zinc finger domain-containing protein [Candidatus Bathyarchaeota archaeon]|nr:AN1-type zinc finger domain-containing protein [Candidatus Bathyarchaeota archaeon]